MLSNSETETLTSKSLRPRIGKTTFKITETVTSMSLNYSNNDNRTLNLAVYQVTVSAEGIW